MAAGPSPSRSTSSPPRSSRTGCCSLPLLAIFVTNWAFGTHLLALELLIVVALMGLTARVIWWIAGGAVKSELRFGRFGPALRATALAGFAAVSFTSLTALLYQRGLVGISPAPSDDRVLDVTFSFYLWHMANTVPLVDIPGNLGWQSRSSSTAASAACS